MLEISQAHNEARLIGTRDFLDAGTGYAKLQIYDDSHARPANGATTTCVLLAEIELDKPCGTVTAGLLHLTSANLPLVLATGTAAWARALTANGTHAWDCTVTETGGGGEVQLPSTTLYVGGTTMLVSAVLG